MGWGLLGLFVVESILEEVESANGQSDRSAISSSELVESIKKTFLRFTPFLFCEASKLEMYNENLLSNYTTQHEFNTL